MDGDVANGHRPELAGERAPVRVAVEDEVGAVRADRRRQPGRAEEGPDRLRLSDERLRDRCVVEQDDTAVVQVRYSLGGEDVDTSLDLEKEDGTWKVTNS